jgi:hypothetical protein
MAQSSTTTSATRGSRPPTLPPPGPTLALRMLGLRRLLWTLGARTGVLTRGPRPPSTQAVRTRDPRTRDPRTRDPRTRDPRTRDPRTRDPRTRGSTPRASGPSRSSRSHIQTRSTACATASRCRPSASPRARPPSTCWTRGPPTSRCSGGRRSSRGLTPCPVLCRALDGT